MNNNQQQQQSSPGQQLDPLLIIKAITGRHRGDPLAALGHLAFLLAECLDSESARTRAVIMIGKLLAEVNNGNKIRKPAS